jgi:hypothetical protein
MRAPQPVAATSRILAITLVAIVFGAAAACTSEPANPTMPSGPSFEGTWVGAVKPAAIIGSLQLTLVPSVGPLSPGPGQYSGRWTMTFPDGRDNSSGLTSGRAFAALLTLTLQSSIPGACPLALTGTLDSAGTRIDGSMAPMSCGGTVSTPFTLSKQ